MTVGRRLLAPAVAALALVSLLAGPASAADAPDVTGTVTEHGAPVAGASVQVLIAGSDMVFTATTDSSGAWAVTAGVAPGQTLTVSASGATTQSRDSQGCTVFSTPTGHVEVAVEALPLAPVAVVLDTVVTSRVCDATPTPRRVPTLPATDMANTAGPTPGAESGWLLVVLGLAAVAFAAVAPARRGRAGRR